MNILPIDKRVRIVAALVEGNSLRAISRMVGVSINTVMKFVADFGPVCEAYHDLHVRNVAAKRVQCDEIWAFCYAKDKNLPPSMRGKPGVGSVWTWTALDSDSKLMIGWMVGDRDADCAGRFMMDLSSRLEGRCQLTTDGHAVYERAVADAFGWQIDYPIAWRNAIAAQVVLGERKNIERANDIKGAMRNVLREAVAPFDPFLKLQEVEECTSFDHVLVDWNGTQVAVRWGRIPSTGAIRRNPTTNTAMVQEQGALFAGVDKLVGEVPLYTYGYTVERDFTLAGIPQGYLERINLCREWADDYTETVTTLAIFPEPADSGVVMDDGLLAARIRERATEAAQLRAVVRSIRKRLAS